jgi:formate C-acetyltransferase
MELRDNASERIKALRSHYLNDIPSISIERARYYTRSWQESEGRGLSPIVRVAMAMKNVYEHMNIAIHPLDHIAGTWTEYSLGIPIDIERGLFNDVFAVELKKNTMIRHLIRSNLKFIRYMIKTYGLRSLFASLAESKAVGAAMPSIGTKPLDKRPINPYRINPTDKRLLLKTLLPFWRSKTIAEKLRDHLIEERVFSGDMEAFFAALPSTTAKNDTIISLGAAIGTWQGHLILDHETPIKRGLLAMLAEVERKIETQKDDPEKRDFYTSQKIALDGVITYAQRLIERIAQERDAEQDPVRKKIVEEMHETCTRVPLFPARSFREAVQAYWTVKTAVELAVPFNVHAPGRLDQYFYPYYRRDEDEGRISREGARELLEELLLKVMTHNMRPYSNYIGDFSQRYEGSEPVTLGGLKRDGTDATNELTYLLLEAAEHSRTALNIVVRIHENSPAALLETVSDLHYHGASSISLMNDEVSTRAMMNRGFAEADARDYAITGCVDMCSPGKTGGIGFSALLLCRILDTTLRNGDAKTLVGTVGGVGLKTGDPDSFASFDELLSAFIAQGKYMIETIVAATHIRDRLYAEELPAPYISAFMGGCLEAGRDVTQSGAVYDLEGILFMNSIANVTDSLYVIKKLVFEEKILTIRDLIEAVDHNFVGYGDIHRRIMGVEGKWGNGASESDEIARTITTRLFLETYNYRTYKGGPYAPFINSMTAHTYDGRISLATPDGRKAAQPFAASCNPYNVDRAGLTGVLRSVSALDFEHVLGCAVNIRLHPSAIGKTAASRKKYAALLSTYFDLGGEQVQPTVASTETLCAAQEDPDSYRTLIVKVGGYSAYFVDLGREIQDEIISRSEHTMGV